MALVVQDLAEGRADLDATGWTEGDTDIGVAVSGGTVRISILTIDLLATETDYELAITDAVAGPSTAIYDLPATDARFTVTGADGQARAVAFRDADGDGRPGNGDVVYILEPDADGEPELAWELRFSADGSTTLPEPGDTFRLVPVRSLQGGDAFEFEARLNTAGGGDAVGRGRPASVPQPGVGSGRGLVPPGRACPRLAGGVRRAGPTRGDARRRPSLGWHPTCCMGWHRERGLRSAPDGAAGRQRLRGGDAATRDARDAVAGLREPLGAGLVAVVSAKAELQLAPESPSGSEPGCEGAAAPRWATDGARRGRRPRRGVRWDGRPLA